MSTSKSKPGTTTMKRFAPRYRKKMGKKKGWTGSGIHIFTLRTVG
jgi:hypothetical protein